ncbi:MAG: hypothetical protein AAGB04_30310 [Pseudomonadota bacterium]
MSPLMTLLVTNTALVLKASTVVAASALAVTVGASQSRSKGIDQESVARHTLSDIGVEPGSLTWIR